MREFLSDTQGYSDAVAMLRAVLDGETYQNVGRRYGVTRSTVERRIKGLAEHLLLSVGIEGLSLSSTAFIRRLRQYPEAVEQALAQGAPCGNGAQSVPLSREVLQSAIEHLRAESTRVAHDLALFYVLFTTGMRPLELARLTVRDCLNEAGHLQSISELRAETTLNGHARPLYLTNPRLVHALEDYLQERQRRGHGLGEVSRYGGLCPDSPLFLNPYGQAYSLICRDVQGVCHHRCRGMQTALRKMFRYAGLSGLTVQDARITLSALLYEGGADESQLGLLLGIRDNSAVRAMLRRPRPRLTDLTQNLL